MPSIVYVSKLDNKVPRRKPAIAHMVIGTQLTEVTSVTKSDVDDLADEVDTSADSRWPAKPTGDPQDSLQTSEQADAYVLVPVDESKEADASASVPLAKKKGMGCVIS